MTPKKFLQIKQEVEQLQRQRDQAIGGMKNLKEQLKKDYACSTLKEAKELLRKIESQIEKLEEQIQALLSTYEPLHKNQSVSGNSE